MAKKFIKLSIDTAPSEGGGSDFLYDIASHLDFDNQYGVLHGTVYCPVGLSGLGNAVSLNNGYISTGLKPAENSFTLSFWMKNNGITGDGNYPDPLLVSNKDWSKAGWSSGFALGWEVQKQEGKNVLLFSVGGGEDGKRADVRYTLPYSYENEWIHIIAVVDRENETVKFYINFTPVDDDKCFDKDGNQNTSLDNVKGLSFDCEDYYINIGQDGTGNYGYSLNAAVDEFIFFNGALTEDNVKKLKKYYADKIYGEIVKQGIVGVTGVTNESGTLTFTDDIAFANMSGYTQTANGDYVSVTSPLSDYFPFNKIEEFTDDSGNTFVKFPKLWMKWETDDANRITGYKFAEYQVDEDYFIPDAYLDPNNTTTDTYLDYFALGKYEMSGTKDKGYSVSGATLLTDINREEGRAAARAYGSSNNLYNGYQMLDFAQLTLYNLMCMMFYGTANIQHVFSGRTGLESDGAEWEEPSITGTTDGVNGLNGWNVSTDCVKMLGVENPYGNASKWVDGVNFVYGDIYAQRFSHQYTDSEEDGIALGFNRPTSNGYVIALKHGTTDETKSFAYACEVSDAYAAGFTDKYFGDWASCNLENNSSVYALFSGGSYGGAYSSGLWYLDGGCTATESFSHRGARLAFRPVNG